VLTPDGRVVFVPASTDHAVIFDPASKSNPFETVELPPNESPNGVCDRYSGGVLVPDINKIVFAPFGVNRQGGVLDLASSKIEPFDVGEEGEYFGAVLAKNGKVVFVPYKGAIGIFDPVTKAFETEIIGANFKENENGLFSGGVLVPDDGRIVFVPTGSKFVGIFDPESRHFETVSMSFGGSFRTGMWVDTLRKVLFVPDGADRVGFFDPESKEVDSIVLAECSDPHIGKYFGGVLLPPPDSRAVFVPVYANNIGLFDTDPAANEFKLFDLKKSNYIELLETSGTGKKFSGGVLLPDGRVVLVPSEASVVIIFEPTKKPA
jgi:streptogramin lyase